jgi:hypothetical protein
MDGRLKHGMRNTSIYGVWRGMHKRCYLETEPAYHNYGGRGIRICNGWYRNFINFNADMGPKPDGYSIDRIDNDGGYWCGHCDDCISHGWPANCQWATAKQQANNRRVYVSKSGFPGVYRRRDHFEAYIIKRELRYFIGSYKNAQHASYVRNAVASYVFGGSNESHS